MSEHDLDVPIDELEHKLAVPIVKLEHDLFVPITLEKLNNLYTPQLTLFINVQGVKYEYKTVIDAHEDGGMDYQFLDTHESLFLNILVKDTIAEIGIELVHKNVKRIKSLTPLETVFYLSTWFCTMVGITDIKLIDAAHSVCKDDDEHEKQYPLKVYRMFSTHLPAPSITIYSKFFKYRQVPILDKTDSAYLDRIRHMTIGYIKEFSQEQMEVTREKLDTSPPEKMSELLRTYKMFQKKIDPISSLPPMYDDMTIAEFFDTFLHKQNCQKYSVLLKSVHMFLLKDQQYQALSKKISNYTVKVSDSIYYHNMNPQSMYSGTKKSQKRNRRRYSRCKK